MSSESSQGTEMSGADTAVLSLCDEVWKWRLSESPELASFCGFHQYDDRWDDISEDAYNKRELCIRHFLEKAEALDVKSCSQDVALSHALLVDDLKLYLKGVASKSYLMPLNYLEGIHVDFNMTISYMKFDTEEDFNKYISRLVKLPLRIEQVIVLLKKGVQESVVHYISSVKRVPEQIDNILNSPVKKMEVLKPFTEDHPKIPKEKLAGFEVQAKDLVTSKVVPALKVLKDYLEKEYFTHLRPNEGINSLKDGAEWYQRCLDFHLSCSMTPHQVHEIGLNEVARIHTKILDLARVEELGNSCTEILDNITKRQENHFRTRADVMKHVKDLCYIKIRPKISQMFKDLPDINMKIQEAPDYMKSAPAGFYLSGTSDGSREGTYFINNHDLKTCLPYQLPALCLHEGEPGHHLQGIYALASTHLPDFRRYSEDSKYYLCPAKFSFNTAYVEGWGLYSEALGEELMMYTDNLDLLGRYGFEIFRAARLVVDTGIHAFGWSKEKAVKFMVDNCLSPKSEIIHEVERYITWPGQACAYKIGEIKLWNLRRKAEKELGSKFDIKEFHHHVLSCGAVPLRVLEIVVDQYIVEARAVN